MSEFTGNHKQRVERLTGYMTGLIEGRRGADLLAEYQIPETSFVPQDIIMVFDHLFQEKHSIEDIKTASNKLFNILYKKLSETRKYDYGKNPVLETLVHDNLGVKKLLADARSDIKQINRKITPDSLSALTNTFLRLEKFTTHYTVTENIIFPEIEKHWDHYQCLKIMWSFHDDIRTNIRKTLEILRNEPFDLERFNQGCSKVYFNISTIAFREEYILFPVMHENLGAGSFQRMRQQLNDFNLLFVDIKRDLNVERQPTEKTISGGDHLIKLSTGELNLEQIELIFNHLPVDVTFVDEENRVKYFSTPKERSFPRTTGIIGRKVQDCHPHESVHVVNKIIEAFRLGERDDASFWIKIGPKFVLIRYFAVRDINNIYKGVLEVSQEISDIQNLSGERRLLDW